MFTGVMAYADDLVLLAPSQQMRQMLRICEYYAGKYVLLRVITDTPYGVSAAAVAARSWLNGYA